MVLLGNYLLMDNELAMPSQNWSGYQKKQFEERDEDSEPNKKQKRIRILGSETCNYKC
jgi:hypothetical protein